MPLAGAVVVLDPVLLVELSSFLPQADSDRPTTTASTVATDLVVIVIREPPGFADCRVGTIDAIQLWPRGKNRAIPHATLACENMRNLLIAFAFHGRPSTAGSVRYCRHLCRWCDVMLGSRGTFRALELCERKIFSRHSFSCRQSARRSACGARHASRLRFVEPGCQCSRPSEGGSGGC